MNYSVAAFASLRGHCEADREKSLPAGLHGFYLGLCRWFRMRLPDLPGPAKLAALQRLRSGQ